MLCRLYSHLCFLPSRLHECVKELPLFGDNPEPMKLDNNNNNMYEVRSAYHYVLYSTSV